MDLSTQNQPVRFCSTKVGFLASTSTHQLTMLVDSNSEDRLSGMTVWRNPAHSVTCYWRWTINDDGIVVMDGANSIKSNIVFSKADATLEYGSQCLALQHYVHLLPWQQRVYEHLKALGVNRKDSIPRTVRVRKSPNSRLLHAIAAA